MVKEAVEVGIADAAAGVRVAQVVLRRRSGAAEDAGEKRALVLFELVERRVGEERRELRVGEDVQLEPVDDRRNAVVAAQRCMELAVRLDTHPRITLVRRRTGGGCRPLVHSVPDLGTQDRGTALSLWSSVTLPCVPRRRS